MDEDPPIFLVKDYKELESKERDYKGGGVMIQTLEGYLT